MEGGAPGCPLKNFNFFRGYIFWGALKPPQKWKIPEKNYWTLFITLKGILFRGGMMIFSRNKFLRDFLVRAIGTQRSSLLSGKLQRCCQSSYLQIYHFKTVYTKKSIRSWNLVIQFSCYNLFISSCPNFGGGQRNWASKVTRKHLLMNTN